MVPSRRLAPTSATPRGASSAAMERASPRCSRAYMTSREDWVGLMSKCNFTTPSSIADVGL